MRTFEGTSLPAVLAQVRAEVGDAAVIVSATKRRAGGVGGFFSKELFEVVVEVGTELDTVRALLPATVADALPPAPVDPMAALLGLADAASARDARPSAPAVAPTPVAPAAAPRALAAPAMAVAPATAPVAPPAPAFSALYDRAVAMVAAGPAAPVSAPAPANATFSDLLASRLSPGGGDPGRSAPTPAPAAVSVVPDAVPDIDVDVRDDGDGDGGQVASPAASSRTRRSPRRLARLRPAFTDAPRLRREDLVAPAPPAVAGVPTPVAEVTDETREEIAADQPTVVAAAGAPTTLSRLGLPIGYLPDDEHDVEQVAAALGDLPAASPLTRRLRGAIVVMGAPEQARRLAAAIAEDLLGDASAVLVAQRDVADVPAWLWLRHPADVAARRTGWMQRKAPVVVALCVPGGEDGMAWAGVMAGALRPTVLHVALPAATGAERLRSLLEELPPVDGLHLLGAATATAPAAVLSVGVPVVSLDGQPASPEAWAELLVGKVRDGAA